MCGRYGFSVKNTKNVYEKYNIQNELFNYIPRYNIAPGQMNPVITKNGYNKISRMFWGLIPYWAQDKSFSFRTINARSKNLELQL